MTDADWTYGRVVADNITRARARLRLSQKSLGSRMKVLGFSWRQQIVAAVENGDRRILVEEVPALAIALETTLQDLLSPPESDRDGEITLPSGQAISSEYVTSLVYGMSAHAVTWSGDEPSFGPETRRAPVYAQRFVELMRTAGSGRPVTIKVTDAGGSAVTYSWPETGTPSGYP